MRGRRLRIDHLISPVRGMGMMTKEEILAHMTGTISAAKKGDPTAILFMREVVRECGDAPERDLIRIYEFLYHMRETAEDLLESN